MEETSAPSGGAPAPAPKGKGLWIGIAVVVVVVVLLLALVLSGFFNPPVPEEQVLRIGTVLSLTGISGLEVFGPNNLRGIQLAVKEINAAGGVLGRNIEVVSEDDGGVEATATDRATKLVTTNRVDAIIGAVGSGFCAAVLEVTRANSVAQVSASCTSPIFSNLTYTQGWFFRTAPSDALQGVVAANYSYNVRGWRTMVALGNNNPYGSGLANVFAGEFNALGGTATVTILPLNLQSYTSDLQAAFGSTPPEAVYMAEYPTDGLKVMRDWAANSAWSGVEWLFSEGVLEQAGFIDKLPAQGIDNATLRTFQGSAPGAYLGIVGDRYDGFLARYRAEYGATADPGLFSSNAYDAVYLIASATQKAGRATGADIKAQLRSVATPTGTVVTGGEWSTIRARFAAGGDIDYDGASGALDLDQYGDPLSGYAIWGINATNRIYTVAEYNETTVVEMLGAPPGLASASAPFVLEASAVRARDT